MTDFWLMIACIGFSQWSVFGMLSKALIIHNLFIYFYHKRYELNENFYIFVENLVLFSTIFEYLWVISCERRVKVVLKANDKWCRYHWNGILMATLCKAIDATETQLNFSNGFPKAKPKRDFFSVIWIAFRIRVLLYLTVIFQIQWLDFESNVDFDPLFE